MDVHTFRGQARVFGFTKDNAGSNLPPEYGPWAFFKTIEIIRGEEQRAVKTDECLDDIETFGFHLTDAHVRITDKLSQKE